MNYKHDNETGVVKVALIIIVVNLALLVIM
jgi:hypothetical protein